MWCNLLLSSLHMQFYLYLWSTKQGWFVSWKIKIFGGFKIYLEQFSLFSVTSDVYLVSSGFNGWYWIIEICLSMKVPMVTTESGLQYKDIKVGRGPSPPIGFQVCKLFWLLQTTSYLWNNKARNWTSSWNLVRSGSNICPIRDTCIKAADFLALF